MTEPELRLKVLELIKDILHNSYVETKARTHNEWSIKADLAWKISQKVLPFPHMPEYFTEWDLLYRVQPMWQFVLNGELPCESASSLTATAEPVNVADSGPESDTSQVTPEAAPEWQPHDPIPLMTPPEPMNVHTYSEPVNPVIAFQAVSNEPSLNNQTSSPNKGLKVLPAWMTTKRA